MNEREQESLEERTRMLFDNSVENLDMRVRSRLTQARYAALEAAASRTQSWLPRKAWWTPAAGVAAAVLLAAALWVGTPLGSQLGHHTVSLGDAQNLEDLDIVATSDESGDAMEMLQDDLDFYDFAEKVDSPEPAV